MNEKRIVLENIGKYRDPTSVEEYRKKECQWLQEKL
jgi:hypothetical protein